MYFFSQYIWFHTVYWSFWRSHVLRDRPFNLKGGGYGFLCRSEFFFRTTRELEYFFPISNISLYDKNSESEYFFPSTKIRIFFFNWNQNIFFRKKPCELNPVYGEVYSDTTLCDKVRQWLATCQWFSPAGTPIPFTNKTDRHDIAGILLKVALNTINPNNFSEINYYFYCCSIEKRNQL
jgi:hypothetical protein